MRVRRRTLRRVGSNTIAAGHQQKPATAVLHALTESVVFVATIWAAVSLGTIYLLTHSVAQVYRELYGWGTVQAGNVQSGIVIGEVLGAGLSLYTNRWYDASDA